MLQNNSPTNPNLPLIDHTGSVKVITNYQRMPMNKRKESSHLTNIRKFIKISNISHVPQQQSQQPKQQEEKKQTIINHQKRHYSSQFVKKQGFTTYHNYSRKLL
uniref:Uncharacterized protein n=1 Tax=Schizaphis graminum TaxID=13262 RepID=A0A2S2NM45_SCHGA